MKVSIKEQLELIYEGDPWYGGAIKPVLESLNPAVAFNSPGKGVHSIAELVAHMIAWRKFVVERLKGDNSNFFPDQEKSFEWKKFSCRKKKAWSIMLEQFDLNQQNFLVLLDKKDDTFIDLKVPGKSYTFDYLLTGIIQHDLYHLGQIIYIEKLFNKESKPPERGILKYDYRIFPFEGMTFTK